MPAHAGPLTIGCVALLFGCDEGLGCDGIGAPQAPMFQVTVTDSVSGAPAWWGASGHIVDGAYRHDFTLPSTTAADSVHAWQMYTTDARAGSYSVIITKPGYETWRVDDQSIVQQGCFLTSRSLEARLVRVP